MNNNYSYDYGHNIHNYYDYYKSYTLSPSEIRQALCNFTCHLKEYDSKRLRLEQEGGQVGDLARITNILNTEITLSDQNGRVIVSSLALSNQSTLHQKIRTVDFDLHLDIRSLSTGMPVYYLCRVKKDYWDAYSLIVEDLYMSPGYPVTDERFIKLMESGREVYYLRLSQYRTKITAALNSDGNSDEDEIDNLLYGVGRHVFQAAWHDEQRLAAMVHKHLGLKHFQHAIELLYLCLSGELCELRGITDKTILNFFEHIYPQPALRKFLRMLSDLDGRMLNNLPQKASDLYTKLIKSFSRFMLTEVTWGARKLNMPLWKLICGNFYRLHKIGSILSSTPDVIDAAAKLDSASEIVIKSILSGNK